ncbi:MAG: hypothetical protein D6812_09375 [Deltaproteobacteria bacterium]|nr:MAG: hypothetical protein D6812_09375 [Deltaproteobacteria bacterium]
MWHHARFASLSGILTATSSSPSDVVSVFRSPDRSIFAFSRHRCYDEEKWFRSNRWLEIVTWGS